MGWLVYCGHLIGDVTGYTDVRTLTLDAVTEFNAERGPVIHAGSSSPWRFPDSVKIGSTDEAITLVRDEIAAFLHAAVALPTRSDGRT